MFTEHFPPLQNQCLGPRLLQVLGHKAPQARSSAKPWNSFLSYIACVVTSGTGSGRYTTTGAYSVSCLPVLYFVCGYEKLRCYSYVIGGATRHIFNKPFRKLHTMGRASIPTTRSRPFKADLFSIL